MFGQTTYTVTSTSKDGPGSIIEAITLANNNPGADIIEFTPGLQVNASYPQFTGSNSNYMISITESVTIDGKGGALNGSQKWISANGDSNPLGICPKEVPSTIILRAMPNFMEVGVKGQNNSGITVTIKNLSIKEFNSIAEIREGTSLALDNFSADKIWSTFQCIDRGLFEVLNGASLSLKDSQFTNSMNWGSEGFVPAIGSVNSSDLTIENCLFYNINGGKQFLISWLGANSSKVNIVNSRLLGAGGVKILGSVSKTNIVNTTMVNNDTGTPSAGDQIINNATGPMNITSSSIKWNTNKCAANCPIASQILIESKNGPINLSESAIGFNFSETTGTLLATLGVSGSGTFTADTNTWIEPTSNQNASALQTITSQPSLITGTPGFKSSVITQVQYNDSELVTPDVSGVLIDVISTTLTNPIDGNPITKDAIGNDRFDANGFRDIGAIQLGLAPSLTVTATGDQSVDLAWQKPLHHNGASIVRYEYQYVEASGGSPTIINAGKNLTAKITGLTNGTKYNFTVRAVYDESGSEVNGPFSNIGSETPYGTLATPTLTVTPGDAQVSLSWNLPDLGGRTFQSYVIVWKIDGTTNYIDGAFISDPNQTTKTITNLVNETTYEFAFKVKASGDFSSNVYKTATPSATLGLENLDSIGSKFSYYPNPIKNHLHINLDKNTHTKVFSINGSLLIDAKVSKHIDVSSLSSGLYILQVQVDGKVYSGKILKN